MLLSDNKSQSDCSRLVGATLECTVPYNWDYAGITCCKMRTTPGYIRYRVRVDTCHCGNGRDDCFHRWKQLFIVHRPAALLFDPRSRQCWINLAYLLCLFIQEHSGCMKGDESMLLTSLNVGQGPFDSNPSDMYCLGCLSKSNIIKL